ncbi:MAG: sigma-70 family RNA polymerase sigma factor, partial [Leptospirales bacterium]
MDELRRQELETLARRAAKSYPFRPDLLDPIFEYYYPRLRRFAFSYFHDDDQAADIAQTTIINLYRFLPGFRFESSMRSWLYQIALNEVRKEAGRETRREH